MAQKRRKNRPASRTDMRDLEAVTSRLMVALLYCLFYAFALYVLFLILGDSIVSVAPWVFLLGLLGSAVCFAVAILRGVPMKQPKQIHSVWFVAWICLVCAIAQLPFLLFSQNGYWGSAAVCALACFSYFLSIVYERWIVILGALALLGFVGCFGVHIPLFETLLLYRLFYAVSLCFLEGVLAWFFARLCLETPSSQRHSRAVCTSFGLIFAFSALSAVSAAFFSDLVLWCSLAAPLAYFILLSVITFRKQK